MLNINHTTPTTTDITDILTHNENLLAKQFNRANAKVISALRKGFHFNYVMCEDLASEGIAYAARYFLDATRDAELTTDGLIRTATWAAKNRAKDLLRYLDRRPESLSLDKTEFDDDGELLAESPLMTWASLRAWQERAYDRRWRMLGEFAYRHLEDLFDLLHLSPLRREVFRRIYLENEKTAVVCADVHIKPNYAYGIVFAVKKGLAAVGPAFLRAA